MLPHAELVDAIKLRGLLEDMKGWNNPVVLEKYMVEEVDVSLFDGVKTYKVDKILSKTVTSGDWLGGKDLTELEESIPKVIALAWEHENYRKKLLATFESANPEENTTQAKIDAVQAKFADVSLPKSISLSARNIKHIPTIKGMDSRLQGSGYIQERINWRTTFILDVRSLDIEAADAAWELVIVYPEIPSPAQILDQMVVGAVSNPLYSYTKEMDETP